MFFPLLWIVRRSLRPSAVAAASLLLAAAALASPPIVATPAQVSVLYDSAPAAVSVVDLAGDKLVVFDPVASGGSADGARILLPVPKGEKSRCQGAISVKAGGRLWVATDSRLVRLDPKSGRVDRNLPLPADLLGSAVDLVPFLEPAGERVAVAFSPANPSKVPPGVVVLDGSTGALVSRYGAVSAAMNRVWALERDETSGRFVLANRRDWAGLHDLPTLTGLQWDGTGFSETAAMEILSPEGLPGDAALSRVAPGIGVAVSPNLPAMRVIDLSIPTGWGENPDAETWGVLVAVGADPSIADPWGHPDLFYADAEAGELVRSRGFDGTPVVRSPIAALGASPAPGSHLVVSASDARVAVSSPTDGRILLLDPMTLATKALVAMPQPRPTALLLLR